MTASVLVAATSAFAAPPPRGGGLETFTLPAPSPGGGLYFGDLQSTFPDVDWDTLDRLYLPAGHWSALLLGNLPTRTADRPLVITNLGGQVKIGGLGAGSHAILILGGSHWRLTGRFDPVAQTGDTNFRGHRGGYAGSAGQYGIFIDDAFESTGDSGLTIAGGATNFEIDFIEITRVGFAGALVKTDDQGDAHMSEVRFHDNYVHDTGSEGLYFGSTQSPPQHKFPNLKIYNNRIVRTGTEAIQLGQVGRGSEIHNNVILFGALDWKNPFQPFQDNAGQFGVREGDVSFHHNILIGGAASFFQFFPQPRDGDTHLPGDEIVFHDNYFSHSRNFGAYVHAQSDLITEFVFRDN
ncbi:MAG: right-handed parallel beta-helix repeat-containing protein, partial [Acidobacteriota bacterium]